jgi:protein-S-isoprenylcysteine O-methyltransferase Ste14
MKLIDIPPVWLLLCILVAWGQSRYLPIDWGSGATWTLYVGGGLVVGGIVLAVLAVLEMRKAKTTVIPHMEPDALVTTGVFSFTRNPIYLADVMILLGLILWWGAIISLILVPLFLMMIERRFIIPEEARLRAAFGEAFDAYVEKVHRWL